MNSGCQWLDEYAKGSEEAFGKFVRQYASLVYSVARRRLGNDAAAEEAAQLVFIRVARSRPKFADQGKLVAWLHRAATNVAIDLWRAEARRKAREAEALFMQQQLADEDLEALAKQLDEAIDRLEEQEREAILLRFFATQRMAEVGSALGVSEDAAKMRVSRAVGNLRKRLGKAGVVCGEAALLGFLSQRVLEAAPTGMIGTWAKLAGSVPPGNPIWMGRSAMLLAGSVVLLIVGSYSGGKFREKPPISAVDEQATTQNATATVVAEEAAAGSVEKPQSRKFILLNGETREPVEGASVRFEYFDQGRPVGLERVVSDRDGVVVSKPHSSDLSVGMNVFADGFVPVGASLNRETGEGTALLDVGRTFSGMVLSEDGEPVPGVLIRVRCQNVGVGAIGKSPSSLAFNEPEAFVMSDAGGEWRLPFIPKWWSDISLVLMKEGFALTPATVPSRDADPTRVDIVIKRGATIIGRVSDEDGKPVAGAWITESWPTDMAEFQPQPADARLYSAPKGRVVRSDQLGRFEIEKVCSFELDGKVRLFCAVEGLVGQVRRLKLREGTNWVDIKLHQKHVLRGVIMDDEGKVLAGATITPKPWWESDDSLPEYSWRMETDVDGKFEWDAAPRQTSYRVYATLWEVRDGKRTMIGYEPVTVDLIADGTVKEVRLKRPGRSR